MEINWNLVPAALAEILDRLDGIENKIGEGMRPERKPVKSGYITRKDVCKLLNITLPTLHAWVKQGKLQAYHIGGRTLFQEDEVMNAAKPVNYSLNK